MARPARNRLSRNVRRAWRRLWVPLAIRAWPLARAWYRRWDLELADRPDEPVWYFAYGSNMHAGTFRDRRRLRPDAWTIGRLPGWRLRFNLQGWPIGRAAPANIAPDAEEEVWGVLYRLTWRQLVWLNLTEGVPGRVYQPTLLPVETADHGPLEAVAYVAEGLPEDGRPSRRYITLLRDGARAHGLPAAWLARLDAVEPAPGT